MTGPTPQTVIITGASSGIGAAAARQLQRHGAQVVIVGRSPSATQTVAAEIGADYHLADFAKLSDVRALAHTLLETYPRIDVLANNAGGVMGDRAVTEDGHEKTFQVNYLAPFLLSSLLIERLIASRARIINTSSVANQAGSVNLDDLDHTRSYTAFGAYGTAKLMNIMHAKELQRRYGAQGIAAAAFHPGIVATGFGREGKRLVRYFYNNFLAHVLMTSPEKGADTLVWLSTAPQDAWQPGGYYVKRKLTGTNSQANDSALVAGLWEASERMLQRG